MNLNFRLKTYGRYGWSSENSSRIKPLKELARKLRPYLHGIAASAHYPLNTGILGVIYNKIKLIKRVR
nr:transposase [Vibrio diabolicus]